MKHADLDTRCYPRMHIIMAQPDLVHNLPGLTHVDLGPAFHCLHLLLVHHKEPTTVEMSGAVAFRGGIGCVDNYNQTRDLLIR